MKKLIIAVIACFSFGCRNIVTEFLPSRNYFTRISEEKFSITGSVITGGWGIENNSFKQISFYVPGRPYLTYLYYSGRNQAPLEDKFLTVNGRQILGKLIYGEIPGNPPPELQYIFTVRYDVTPFVKKGDNDLKVWGFDAFHNDGLGLAAIYQDAGGVKNKIILKDGLGFFWAGIENKKKQNSHLVEFKIDPGLKKREARVFMMFAGGAPSPRDDRIWFLASDKKVEQSIISKGKVLFENEISSKNGKEWDLIDFNFPIDKDIKYIYFQVESPQITASPNKGDSLNFVSIGLELPAEDK